MYIDEFSDQLRQGDVILDIFYRSPEYCVLKKNQLVFSQNTAIRKRSFAIVSQCCELILDGSGKPRRNYALVAPLLLEPPLDEGTEQYRKMLENGEFRPDNDPIQFFYFAPHGQLTSPAFLDFSAIMPVKTNALYEEWGTRKVLQLDPKHRHLLRLRLRDYFSRIPDDEEEIISRIFP